MPKPSYASISTRVASIFRILCTLAGNSTIIDPIPRAIQMRIVCMLVCSLLVFTTPGRAAERTIVWLFGSDPHLYSGLGGQSTCTITNGGITATISASDGTLTHLKTAGISVNSSHENDPCGIDPGEHVNMVFDKPLMITAFSVKGFNTKNDDRGVIRLNGIEMAIIDHTGYKEIEPFFIPAGWILRVENPEEATTKRLNGWSLTSISTSPP